MTRVRKAVVPVAGLGTRVLPATKAIPKEMLTVVDRPAIHYVVEEAFSSGIEHVVFVTGRNKGAIEDYFDRAYELEATLEAKGKNEIIEELRAGVPLPGTTSFVRQQAPLGLGHAVWCARDVIGDEPFAVLLPDDLVLSDTPCLKQMIDAHARVGGSIVAVERVPDESVSKYGIVDCNGAKEGNPGDLLPVRGMVEKPNLADAPSRLAVIGRYILDPSIFDMLELQKPGAGGEIQLTDAMSQLLNFKPFHALRYQGERHDCGDKLGYLRAIAAYALARPDLGAAAREIFTEALGHAAPRPLRRQA